MAFAQGGVKHAEAYTRLLLRSRRTGVRESLVLYITAAFSLYDA